MPRKKGDGKYHLTNGTIDGQRTVSVRMIVEEYIRKNNEPVSANIIYDRLKLGERDLKQLLVKKRTYVRNKKPKETGLTFNQRRSNYYNEQGRLILKTI